jgi:D-serine deaminase-like pyridoxal phosphate-dependent protein
MWLGPNRFLIGKDKGAVDRDLSTPALVVDLDAFEGNLRTMADLVRASGRKLRPHVKAHKSPLIGRMQVEAGAAGLCCATVREAEVMADAGLNDILVTAPVVTPSMVARLVSAADKVAGFTIVADSALAIDLIVAVARADKPLDVLIDVDMGLGRTGATGPEEAVRLARQVADSPRLRYRGIQAYYGHLQHVPALADRHAKVAEQWARLAATIDALAAADLSPEIVSGGGTGTHHLDLEYGPFTEIQPGSYLFMDKQYGAVEIAPGGSPFRTALTVAARVVSVAQPDRVIVDAGSKALSTDAGSAPIADGAPLDATYEFMGDEHGAVRVGEGGERPKLGGRVHFVSPHCDPTVNLYDHFHVMRGGALVDIWPIEARGH